MANSKNKLDEIFDISPDNLSEHVLLSSKPVIIRGLVSHWPLVKTSTIEECVTSLSSSYNNTPINAFIADKSTGGRYFYNHDLSALNFTKQRVNFIDVLQQLAQSKHSNYMYVGSANINSLLPDVMQTHHIPSLTKFNPLASIWLSNQSRIAAHQDMPSNIACCVKGKRKFTLFPPDQINNLYVGPLDFTPAGQAISLVDFHKPDFNRFPKFNTALNNAYVAELSPGDALFIPSMWWHHVEALSKVNILLNFWWNNNKKTMGDPIDVLQHALMNMKSLPTEQKHAWKSIFEHYIFNEDTENLSHIPNDKLGILNTEDELSIRKIRAILLNKLNR